MSGTKQSAKKAAQTNKERYGADYYRLIGRKGGTQTHRSGQLINFGFASDPHRARIAGAIGGTKSKRNKRQPKRNSMGRFMKYEPAPIPKPRFWQFGYKRFLKKVAIHD